MGDALKTLPQGFALADYDFFLPEEQIAQHPAMRRGTSRLLVVDKKNASFHVEDKIFSDIIDVLPENCLLIANNSRVVPARLTGKRASGGKVEFLLLSPIPLLSPLAVSSAMCGDYSFMAVNSSSWRCAEAQGLLKSSKQVKVGECLHFADDLYVELVERYEFGRCLVRLFWQGDLNELFEREGALPLPPYIKRTVTEQGTIEGASGSWGEDRERYQTIYNKGNKAGSVAAPTAGLHFTPELRERLIASGREWVEATLYVGYGTFSPVREEDIRRHTMHAEYVELTAEAAERINKAKKEGRPIIAIGTTSVRIVEGVYRALYADAAENKGEAVGRELEAYHDTVNLFLYPGQHFYMVDGLITNFHLPCSSLLMLVSAFAGRERMLEAYAHAVAHGYQFFSYGDSMFIY